MTVASEEISPDTQAILLLCSGLTASDGPKPLTPGEYNRVAIWLNQLGRRPRDLLVEGYGGGLPEGPDLPPVEHLQTLLERGRLLSLALTKWADFGIWVVSRSDAAYPERLRRLRGAAAPLLFGAGSLDLLSAGGLAIIGSREID
jgi:DNA processing protein